MLLPIDETAALVAGNWKKFTCFLWFDKPECPEECMIYHTRTRDSNLTTLSNAMVIERDLMEFPDDVKQERFTSSFCGWVDALVIRVYQLRSDKVITEAFKTFHALMGRLESCLVLDDADYNRRVYGATIENIIEVGYPVIEATFPEPEWANKVFDWLWNHDDSAVENVDDTGGYPEEDKIREALVALGIPVV